MARILAAVMPKHVSRVRFGKIGEYFEAQYAIDGVLAPPVSIHASDRPRYKSDDEFEQMLIRQSETMIEVFGDARTGRYAA